MNWFKIAENMSRKLKCVLCGSFSWWEGINKDKVHPSCEKDFEKELRK